jgi:hypothetical protein
MIAIEMAIRVRVRFLKVYTSFVVYINPLEIRGRVNTHRISERSLLCSQTIWYQTIWIGQNQFTYSCPVGHIGHKITF